MHGPTWPTGPILKGIEARTLADAMAQAEWVIEAKLKFQPPRRRQRKAG